MRSGFEEKKICGFVLFYKNYLSTISGHDMMGIENFGRDSVFFLGNNFGNTKFIYMPP
jgi:hypothetical protein